MKLSQIPQTPEKLGVPRRTRQALWFNLAVILIVLALTAGTVFLAILAFGPGPVLPTRYSGIAVMDGHDHQVALLESDRVIVPVPLSKISNNLQEAIVSTEDRNFYQHRGVDPLGILRAMMADASAHRFVQGGSTLTQQLVKNVFLLNDRRTLLLKAREAWMAMQIEQHYSKEQILETYLNNVYFGNNAYGVEQASERYFGKKASALSLPEAAYLAGLVNAPSKLGSDKTDAIDRQQFVLDNMAKIGVISQATADTAKKAKLSIGERSTTADKCSYYFASVQKDLQESLNADQLFVKGVRAYTYLNVTAQTLATNSLSDGIRRAPKGVSQGALVSIAVPSGGIVALVGGAGTYQQSPWNRATSPHTAGSAFKPFVYLAGLMTGVVRPDTMIDDAPLEVAVPGSGQVYSPKNFDGRFMGPITVRKALALSRNTCAVRVGEAVGPAKIAEVAHQAGVMSNLTPTLALSLGASAVSPLDMASAYSTLARGGVRIEPTLLRCVTTTDGKVLLQFEQKSERVFDPEPVAELVDALQDVVEKGTATHARLLGRPVAGKTGTADGARDIWFIGFTPDLVTAVWGGNDQNQAIAGKQVTGGSIMAGIWQQYMQAYYAKVPTPPGQFAAPQHPLIEEPEPLNFLPAPASIFQKVMHFLDPADVPPVAPNRANSNDQMPPVAPDRHLRAGQSSATAPGQEPPPPHKPGGVGKLMKKLLKMF
jgi:1A family penicillin-binding protein